MQQNILVKKKKREQKKQRKNNILFFGFSDIIEETMNKILCSEWTDGEFFDEFVEFKNMDVNADNDI